MSTLRARVTRPSLLIVHRDPEFHRPVVARLRAAGIACAEAKSRDEALTILRALRFDYVLIDMDDAADDLVARLPDVHPDIEPIAVRQTDDCVENARVRTVTRPVDPEDLLKLIHSRQPSGLDA